MKLESTNQSSIIAPIVRAAIAISQQEFSEECSPPYSKYVIYYM